MRGSVESTCHPYYNNRNLRFQRWYQYLAQNFVKDDEENVQPSVNSERLYLL